MYVIPINLFFILKWMINKYVNGQHHKYNNRKKNNNKHDYNVGGP